MMLWVCSLPFGIPLMGRFWVHELNVRNRHPRSRILRLLFREWWLLLPILCLSASCGRQDAGRMPSAALRPVTVTNMTDEEVRAFAQQILHPTPVDDGPYTLILDAVRNAGSNDVQTIHDILLVDGYLAKFREPEATEMELESSCLRWQHLTAVKAAERPEVFGSVLLTYYFGSPEAANALSPQEQVRSASLKLIQQGERWAALMDEQDKPKHNYGVQKITFSNDTADVEAAFLKPLAGRGYHIRFKKVTVGGREVWLPTACGEVWVS